MLDIFWPQTVNDLEVGWKFKWVIVTLLCRLKIYCCSGGSKVSLLYGSWRFIAMFTEDHQLNLVTLLYPVSPRSILVLSLCLSLHHPEIPSLFLSYLLMKFLIYPAYFHLMDFSCPLLSLCLLPSFRFMMILANVW